MYRFHASPRLHRPLVVALTALASLLVAGCPGLVSLTVFNAGLLDCTIVGTDGNELLYVAPADNSEPVQCLYSLNVATLQQERIADGLPSSLFADVAANANWFAWVDRDALQVIVQNRATGQQHAYFPGLEQADGRYSFFMLRELRGDALLVQFMYPVGSGSPALDESEYVLLDLLTDSQTIVDHAWGYDYYALGNGYLAIFNDLPNDASPLSLELTANLDLVNLTTGDRQTIAPDIRVAGDGGRVFTAGTAFIWPEFKPGGFNERLMIHDPATGQTSVLLSDTSRDGERRYLRDVSDNALLLQPDEIDFRYLLTGLPTELESFDGQTLASFSAYSARPVFVGDFVAWLDPRARQIAVFDPSSNTTHRLDLPGQ